MSDQTGYGPVPPPVPPSPPAAAVVPAGFAGRSLEVRDNDRSQIIIAGRDVNMTRKQSLSAADIPESELDVVRRAWVDVSSDGGAVTTAADAVRLLVADDQGLAVLAGPTGYGKRTAGIRALWELSQAESARGEKPLGLSEIKPDWDDPESPDISSLPERPGTGYLLDIAAEMSGWEQPSQIAQSLVTHAEKLRRIGSYLVVVADEHGWPEELSGALGRVVVRTKARPSARRVARRHLEDLYGKPERVRWINPAPSPTGQGDAGEASHLLTKESSPSDAARLAALLAHAEDSDEGLKSALAAFQQWRTDVTRVFKETEGKAGDRALLIAALFLSGDTALEIQEASQYLLGKPPETDVEVILTGPDLTTRLRSVGAKVTGRHATVDHKPGYAQAVLNHLWRQRPDIHLPLLKWLDHITAPEQPGAARLPAISDLLVELAITENDIKVIEQIRTWIDNGADTDEHRRLIAGVFTKAADAEALGPKVRAKLLDWSHGTTESVATVIALVCKSEFADQYPQQTLVRLRHILDRPERDNAVQTAEEALRAIASHAGQLPRVWKTVIKWATESRYLAGYRGFLSLLDPQEDPYVLQVMLEAADQNPEVKAALLRGWRSVLADTRVTTQSRDLMIAWAHALADDLVPSDLTVDILRQVTREHIYTSPVAAFVFGEAGVQYDEPVIALRRQLQLPMLADTSPSSPEPAES
ncbi:hypothetical protein ABZ705_12430 [Streptomyces sp. NPDC006984]|uniref:hypothetical protein n=1 Tax=Streptomyces sp. NPDC006984 TaxID=3155463 RepID=UPI00340FC69A